MKSTIHFFIITIFLLSLNFNANAQTPNPAIFVTDLTTTEIKGTCDLIGTNYLYFYEYRSPSFAVQSSNSSSPDFIFNVNNSGTHNLKVIVVEDDHGTYITLGEREVILTVVTVYEDIVNTLGCRTGYSPTQIISELPFETSTTNPDYDLCSLCNYLGYIYNNVVTYKNGEEYVEIDVEMINHYCHHNVVEYNALPKYYDFCDEIEFHSGNKLLANNQTLYTSGSTIKIYNMQGELVLTTKTTNDFNINSTNAIKELFDQRGIFIIEVENENHQLQHQKVVL